MSVARSVKPKVSVASVAILEAQKTGNDNAFTSEANPRLTEANDVPETARIEGRAAPERDAPDSPTARVADAETVVDKAASQTEKRSLKKPLLAGAAAIALLVGGWYGYDYVTVGRFIVSTDDAYVGADMAIIAPKIAANVADVLIDNNQAVKQGEVLVKLDDGDYKLAVDKASTRLATQQATVKTFAARITAAEATAAQTRAQLEAARATLQRTQADFVRTNTLAQKDFTSQASLDAARAANESAKAQVSAGEAAIRTADANVDVLRAQRVEADHTEKELEVALEQAKRDLSFTLIRAPFNGVVGNKSVQVGDYVTPGKRIAAVVPLDKVYVDANLKETQLAHVVPGESAQVRVDALGGAAIKGIVESVAPASGSRFSLLPPDNATGNFTKIVQRVPVRVAVRASDAAGKLRPGLSVVVDIDTRTQPKGQPQQASN